MDEERLYIQAHFLMENGSEQDRPVNPETMLFDFTKYLDANGELYFCEQIIDGTPKNVIVKKEIYMQKKAGVYTPEPQNKKLGILHIMITYIILPLMCLGGLFGFIGVSVFIPLGVIVHADGSNTTFFECLPNIFSHSFIFAACIVAIVNLHKRTKEGYALIHLALLSIIMVCMTNYISTVMNHERLIECLPFELLVSIIWFFCIHEYYKNRIYCLCGAKITNVFGELVSFLAYIPHLFAYISSFIIYAYSVYHMFGASIGEGLFGLFVPGIAQIYFLFRTGFCTNYAYLCYFAAMAYVFGFVTTAFGQE